MVKVTWLVYIVYIHCYLAFVYGGMSLNWMS